jgi:prevent-host-death family protein
MNRGPDGPRFIFAVSIVFIDAHGVSTFGNWSTIWSIALKGRSMSQLLVIGAYETKTHLSDLLRRVRAGQGFTITQRGEPVADLLPTGAGGRRNGTLAAARMQRFVATAPDAEPYDIQALLDDGRD